MLLVLGATLDGMPQNYSRPMPALMIVEFELHPFRAITTQPEILDGGGVPVWNCEKPPVPEVQEWRSTAWIRTLGNHFSPQPFGYDKDCSSDAGFSP